MASLAEKILNQIHGGPIYEDFDYQNYTSDLSGGDLHPVFERCIDHLSPRIIVEVGSWKGRTAIHMASLLKERNIEAAIICVDTWLGGLEHFTTLKDDPTWGINKYRKHGYPSIYYQFLANVMQSGLQDYIVPFPAISNVAARWMRWQRLKADLIFIDASHNEDDVYQDLSNYWSLLREGGAIFGDDWHINWYGVVCAVNRFAKENNLFLQLKDDIWMFQKHKRK